MAEAPLRLQDNRKTITVLVPALPEVVTEGDTEQQALLNAEEAIRAVLDYRRANGLAIPPGAIPGSVTVAA